jgi:outer membrane receptor protein involved in Fe transport
VPNVQQQYLDNPFTVPNPNLAPETAVSWELGATVTPAASPFRASATYFHEDYRNLIRTVPAANSTKQTNANLGKSAAQGVEMEFSYQASRPLTLGANATWVKTEVQDNTGLPADQYPIGEELPFRPHAFGSAFADITWRRWYTSFRGTYVGTQTVLTERFSGQRVPVSAYTLFGVTVSYTASRSLSFYVRTENLFDSHYVTAFDKPGVPLRVTAGIHLSS